jgi:hypothetical protein
MEWNGTLRRVLQDQGAVEAAKAPLFAKRHVRVCKTRLDAAGGWSFRCKPARASFTLYFERSDVSTQPLSTDARLRKAFLSLEGCQFLSTGFCSSLTQAVAERTVCVVEEVFELVISMVTISIILQCVRKDTDMCASRLRG